MSSISDVEKRVKEIRRKTRRKYSAEDKIRIVLEGLRGEMTIAVATTQLLLFQRGILLPPAVAGAVASNSCQSIPISADTWRSTLEFKFKIELECGEAEVTRCQISNLEGGRNMKGLDRGETDARQDT